MEHDLDDPVPIESIFWAFWNRYAEEYMRFARFFCLLALFAALGFPQPAKAQQQQAHGIICDTADQVRRFVTADDTRAILSAINAEKTRSCALMNVSFYVGNIDGTIVTKDGVWQIAHVLIVGVLTHGGVQSVRPKPQWLAIAVASEGA
jgi:hypothetical protein